jgi:hypothetical protein
VIGIGTLALFSGLITASYLNQLRIRRDQHHAGLKHRPGDHPAHNGHVHAVTHAVCLHCGGSIATNTAANAEAAQNIQISPSPQP